MKLLIQYLGENHPQPVQQTVTIEALMQLVLEALTQLVFEARQSQAQGRRPRFVFWPITSTPPHVVEINVELSVFASFWLSPDMEHAVFHCAPSDLTRELLRDP